MNQLAFFAEAVLPPDAAYDADAKEAMAAARRRGGRSGEGGLGTEHLLLGLLSVDGCDAEQLLRAACVDPHDLLRSISQISPSQPGPPAALVELTPVARAALALARDEAARGGRSQIGTVDVLLGITEGDSGVARSLLLDRGVDSALIRKLRASRPFASHL